MRSNAGLGRSGCPSRAPGFRSRPVVASIIAALVLAQSATTVSGDHGGRPIGSFLACDRPGVDPPRCTSVGNTRHHFVHFDDTLTAELAASLRDAMAEQYDPTVLTMHEQEALTAYTDVVVYSEDYGDNGAAGWVYCPTDAPQGTNARGDRWCQQQELRFNLNPRYGVFFADDGSRDHVACHELGHTLGLRHWGNPPQSAEPAAATCMNANTPDGPVALHQIDVDHINAYYAAPRPTRWYRGAHVAARGEGPTIALWSDGVQADEVEHYDSLSGVARAADAVVRGEIVSVEAGRAFGDPAADPLHYAAATIRVSELISGELPTPDAPTVTLEIPLFDGLGALPSLRASLAGNGGVFFLRSKSESAREAGLSQAVQRADAGRYRLVTLRAAVHDDRGLAAVAIDEPGPFAELHGLTFDDAVDRIREAARLAER